MMSRNSQGAFGAVRSCLRHARGAFTAGAAALVLLGSALPVPGLAAPPADWAMFGQNLSNTASTPAGQGVRKPENLKLRWTFQTAGDVSARAAVVNGIVYFPDWGGYLWAVRAGNGKQLWSHALSDYGLPANTHSRTSPAVVDGVLYLGTQEGAWLLAINANTGRLLWKTQLESPANDPFAMITASPVVADGKVFTGVASNQEGNAAFIPGFVCCTARGSVVAVDAATGAIAWKTYTTPPGYNGVGVWGSNFVVDPARGRVFVGTGNNYTHPTDPNYVTCIANGGGAACSDPTNYVDSILSLDWRTGQVVWARRLTTWNQQALGVNDGSDDWNVDCFVFANGNCPSYAGPDYDFASAPNLITYQSSTGPKTILGAGQKSGIYFALDPDSGQTIWQTQVGPGSSLGGMEWGSASDGKRIYVAIANFYGIPSAVGSAGSWAALDPATGAILWQRADPNGAVDIGPLAVSDGVVFASSMAGDPNAPTMLALNAATGQTVWSFAAGSSVNAGATIVKGVVYWGSGYTHLGIAGYTGNNKFFAFDTQDSQ
jgi:polyvinyl alcohol dehydrogenase (cytochrome)